MNTRETKELMAFPKALDEAIVKRFGANIIPKTSFDFFGSMNYVTIFTAKGLLRKRIEDFIAGYTQGNLELRDRMLSISGLKGKSIEKTEA